MPKRARAAHIPQQVRKRKPRRGSDALAAAVDVPEAPQVDVEANGESMPLADATSTTLPAAAATAERRLDARPGRRLDLITRAREQTVTAGRVVPGQLPTFEREFLIAELRNISIVAGSLLALIIVLTIVLR